MVVAEIKMIVGRIMKWMVVGVVEMKKMDVIKAEWR